MGFFFGGGGGGSCLGHPLAKAKTGNSFGVGVYSNLNVFGACLIHTSWGRGVEQSSQWIVSLPDNLARKQWTWTPPPPPPSHTFHWTCRSLSESDGGVSQVISLRSPGILTCNDLNKAKMQLRQFWVHHHNQTLSYTPTPLLALI